MNLSATADTQPVRQLLLARQAELRALLQEAAHAAVHAGDAAPEVQDLKDVAAAESRAIVDDVALAHATEELLQLSAALRRLACGTYGECVQCGEPIAPARLLAMPATAFCTACQATQERPGARR